MAAGCTDVQRTILSQESAKLKAQLEVEAKWRYTTSAELSRLREALEVRRIATECDGVRLSARLVRLSALHVLMLMLALLLGAACL